MPTSMLETLRARGFEIEYLDRVLAKRQKCLVGLPLVARIVAVMDIFQPKRTNGGCYFVIAVAWEHN